MVENFLKTQIKDFKPVLYKPDFRNAIANSWPAVVENSTMIQEIGIEYQYDFEQAFLQLIEDLKTQKA